MQTGRFKSVNVIMHMQLRNKSHLTCMCLLLFVSNSEGANASGYHAFPCFALHYVKDHLKV